MMGGEVGILEGLFGPSAGGLSIFENNPFKRSAQNVQLPSSAPPEQEGKRKKRLSSEVNARDRELDGDTARTYRKLGAPDLNAEHEILSPPHGQGNGVEVSTRKRKKSANGDSGRKGVQEEQVLVEGEIGKKRKKKKKKQDERDKNVSGAENKVGGALLDGEDVETARAVEKEEAGGQTAHASSKRTMSLEKEENLRQVAGDAGRDVEIVSPGKRKRVEGEESNLNVEKKKEKITPADKEERLLRTVFVGNLPTNVKKKAVIKEFSQFGPVESARLRSVPLVDTKLPRKAAVITGQLNEQRTSLNAYVVFNSEECAMAAVAHNMKEFEGRHIRVDLARGPSKEGERSSVEYDKTRTIFVGNLPFDVEDEELITLFAGKEGAESELEGVRVVRDRQTSIGKGFAFVLFKTKEGASRALFKRSVTLRDRKLRIYRLARTSQIEKQRQNHERRKDTWKRSREPPNSGNGQNYEPASKKARGPLAYEGTRASKTDGRPGKWTGPTEKAAGNKGTKRPGGTLVQPKSKRPAVAARKAAMSNDAGAGGHQNKTPLSGSKRKREARVKEPKKRK